MVLVASFGHACAQCDVGGTSDEKASICQLECALYRLLVVSQHVDVNAWVTTVCVAR